MIRDYLRFIIDLYREQLAPIVREALHSTFEFFRLIGSDPLAATEYGATALATIFTTLLAVFYLARGLVRLDSAIKATWRVIKWFLDIVVSAADHFRSIVLNALKSGFQAAFRISTYSNFLSWCSMLDAETERLMRVGYKDGPTQVRYQKNLGLAVISITMWSTLAFSFAVFSAGMSFATHHSLMPVIAVVGGLIYGLLILTLDRSIVAPFSPRENFSNVTASNRGWLRSILLELPSFAQGSLKFVARVVVAVYVARFTALPLTMLLLYGGIVEFQREQAKEEMASVEMKLESIQNEKIRYVKDKTLQQACVNANQAVSESQRRIDDMARAGCRNGNPTCPKDGTAYFERSHLGYVDQQKAACNASEAELGPYNFESNRLSKKLNELKVLPSPDVLQGAIVLEALAKKHASNEYFHPVTATFYLLFVLELFPVLMKLWRDQLINRRRGGDRRSVTVSEDASGSRERRQSDRRGGHLSVVGEA